jgi:hypothetical protein
MRLLLLFLKDIKLVTHIHTIISPPMPAPDRLPFGCLALLALLLVASAAPIGSGDPCKCGDLGPEQAGNCSVKIHECGCLHDLTKWRYKADGSRSLLSCSMQNILRKFELKRFAAQQSMSVPA